MEIDGILAYLRQILPYDDAEITAHTINRNSARAIGVFHREGRAARVGTIGGPQNASYEMLRVTLWVRWGRDGCAADKKSAEIYHAVAERDFSHEGRVGFMRALNAGPVWLGMDDRGIFEFVVDFDLYVEKGIAGFEFRYGNHVPKPMTCNDEEEKHGIYSK